MWWYFACKHVSLFWNPLFLHVHFLQTLSTMNILDPIFYRTFFYNFRQGTPRDKGLLFNGIAPMLTFIQPITNALLLKIFLFNKELTRRQTMSQQTQFPSTRIWIILKYNILTKCYNINNHPCTFIIVHLK